jgi:hypothetical protein
MIQNAIPTVDILLLRYTGGFNRERLSKGKSVISSFIILLYCEQVDMMGGEYIMCWAE